MLRSPRRAQRRAVRAFAHAFGDDRQEGSSVLARRQNGSSSSLVWTLSNGRSLFIAFTPWYCQLNHRFWTVPFLLLFLPRIKLIFGRYNRFGDKPTLLRKHLLPRSLHAHSASSTGHALPVGSCLLNSQEDGRATGTS